MRIDVITIFPDLFGPFKAEGMVRVAREKGLVDVVAHDLRTWTHDNYRTVDDRPYGGGPGMVMKPEPIFEAVEAIESMAAADGSPLPKPRRILLTPEGETLSQRKLQELSSSERLLLICGRYEGFDERIRMGLDPEEISIGDYVLTGGEVPAMAIIEGVARLIPGVLGHDESPLHESFTEGLLDNPHYTRPAEYRGLKVPEVLVSGNHQEIARWRREEALKRTRERRRDLLADEYLIDHT